MLSFLVTSKARRRLLELLFGEGAEGSASELAKQAHVAFAGAYRELQEMKALGFVASAVPDAGGAEVFRANDANPATRLLRDLVRAPESAHPNDDRATTV